MFATQFVEAQHRMVETALEQQEEMVEQMFDHAEEAAEQFDDASGEEFTSPFGFTVNVTTDEDE